MSFLIFCSVEKNACPSYNRYTHKILTKGDYEMKKICFLTLGLAIGSGLYTAQALVPGIPFLETEAGYGYNTAKDGIHSAHIEIAPVKKVILGAEYRHWNRGGNETDIYAKYKLDHVYLGLGNRNYYDRDAKLYGLVEGRANILGPLDGYAGVKLSSVEKEYKVGLQLDIVPTDFDLDVNYTYYDRDNTKNENGYGIGLNYHF